MKEMAIDVFCHSFSTSVKRSPSLKFSVSLQQGG